MKKINKILLVMAMIMPFSLVTASGLVIKDFVPPSGGGILLESEVLAPLTLYFYRDTNKDRLVGAITPVKSMGSVRRLVFDITAPNEVVLQSSIIEPIPVDKMGNIPFDLDIKEAIISKDSVLRARFIDKHGKIVGEGTKIIGLRQDKAKVVLSGLEIDTESSIVQFKAQNQQPTDLTVIPFFRLYDESGILIPTKFTVQNLILKTQEASTVSISFNSVLEPGLYQLEAGFILKDGKSIGGLLRQNFLIDGTFVIIDQFSFDRTAMKDRHFKLTLKGRVHNPRELMAKITIVQKIDKKTLKPLVKEIPLSIEGQIFQGALDLEVDKKVQSLEVRGEVLGKTKVLAYQFPKAEVLPKIEKDNVFRGDQRFVGAPVRESISGNINHKIYLIGGGILILLLGLGFWLIRIYKSKKF